MVRHNNEEVVCMEYFSIGEYAKTIGVTEQTLRNWNKGVAQ